MWRSGSCSSIKTGRPARLVSRLIVSLCERDVPISNEQGSNGGHHCHCDVLNACMVMFLYEWCSAVGKEQGEFLRKRRNIFLYECWTSLGMECSSYRFLKAKVNFITAMLPSNSICTANLQVDFGVRNEDLAVLEGRLLAVEDQSSGIYGE